MPDEDLYKKYNIATREQLRPYFETKDDGLQETRDVLFQVNLKKSADAVLAQIEDED